MADNQFTTHTELFDLSGKYALVTGGTRGIGTTRRPRRLHTPTDQARCLRIEPIRAARLTGTPSISGVLSWHVGDGRRALRGT